MAAGLALGPLIHIVAQEEVALAVGVICGSRFSSALYEHIETCMRMHGHACQLDKHCVSSHDCQPIHKI